MQVRMLETAEGSRDGVNSETFESGKTYDVPPILGNSFVDTGRAEVAERKPTPTDGAPEGEPPEPEEEEEGEVTFEPTSEGSSWYQFRDPDGELITEEDDGEESPITVLGKENAETKRDELEEVYADE